MDSVVEINPLTRVEGHGMVRVTLEQGKVREVLLSLNESPRLFEALLLGKSFLEIPEIICRVCSLCSTVHRLTALLAVEEALGVEVPELARLTRELILYGGHIQSHSLHLYCLVLPDRYRLRGVAELAREHPEILRAGLAIKKVGNLIQETVGGRLIHPVNIIVGGIGRRIPRKDLLMLRDALEEIFPDCRATADLFAERLPLPELPQPNYLAVNREEIPLIGSNLRRWDGTLFPVSSYRDVIRESLPPHSHAKAALVSGKQPTVGALSRLNQGMELMPEAEELLATHRQGIMGQDIRGNTLSQTVELVHAVERSLLLIEKLLEMGKEGEPNVEVSPRGGAGSAACEAPRGTLIHSYDFDDRGICTRADVLTPTSLNQGAMARDLSAAAPSMEGSTEKEMTFMLEQLVRAYDPCISCSVHMVRR